MRFAATWARVSDHRWADQRVDEFGGSPENRIRFHLEPAYEVAEESVD